MKRLTFRTEDGWVGVNNLEDKTVSPTSVAIHKLAEFEDFMEEQGFESLDNLQNYIKKIYKYELGVRKQFVKEINEEEFFNIKEENQSLKDNWQELKKYVETLSNESDTISEDLYFIKDKMQELEKDN